MTGLTERNNGEGYEPYGVDIPKRDIASENRSIGQRFIQFYVSRGYQHVESTSILPEEDKTVIFTGATITPLKKFLQEGIQQPGLVMVQKCLRVKRLDEMFDTSKYPDWTHYFTMCGILSAPGRVENVSDEAYHLLIDELGVTPENLLIEASSRDKDLSSSWEKKGIKVEEDKYPEEYYTWGYGIPNVYGRGLNIVLKHNSTDTYRDLGNVISVENDAGAVLGYEFGFGLESLLSKIRGFKKPMEASTVCSVIPYEEGVKEKLLDALVAAVVIFHHGVEPGRGREKHILKKLVKGISFLRRQMDIPTEQLQEWGNIFELAEFGEDSNSGEKLINGILAYENQLAKYIDYVQNQMHSRRLRGELDARFSQKALKMGTEMGISPTDIEQVIHSQLPKN